MADAIASQDQRNRALEALERRCAAARAELLQQQKKNNYTEESKKEVAGEAALNDSSSVAIPGNSSVSSTIFPSEAKVPNKDVEGCDPIYLTLSAPVHENLLVTNMDVPVSNNRGRVMNKICHELRMGGYAKRSRELKIDPWILLDGFFPKRVSMAGSRMRALLSNSKRSKRHMSTKQHKKCGTFDFPYDVHKFEIFQPMHEMWKTYMMQRLRHVGQDVLARNLIIADLHGAMILVVECKIPSFTGISGIMIRETAETFGLVTKDDKFRVVPKKSSVFVLQYDCWKVTLIGDKLRSRVTGLPY